MNLTQWFRTQLRATVVAFFTQYQSNPTWLPCPYIRTPYQVGHHDFSIPQSELEAQKRQLGMELMKVCCITVHYSSTDTHSGFHYSSKDIIKPILPNHKEKAWAARSVTDYGLYSKTVTFCLQKEVVGFFLGGVPFKLCKSLAWNMPLILPNFSWIKASETFPVASRPLPL